MYEMQRTVTYSQVGSGLKMDMAGIVHYLQDCTLAHSESIGKGVFHVAEHKKAWFLSSWQIEVDRFPEYKEEILVRTWPHEFKSMYGYRNMDIIGGDGRRIVSANSIWIFMDLEKMSPIKPSEEDMKGYDLEEALPMDYAPRKIKQLDEEYLVTGGSVNDTDALSGIRVRKSFLDSNHHVNNGRYVSEALDLIDGENYRKMRVDYRKAAVLGDIMYPSIYRNSEVAQIVLNDNEKKPYVLIELS